MSEFFAPQSWTYWLLLAAAITLPLVVAADCLTTTLARRKWQPRRDRIMQQRVDDAFTLLLITHRARLQVRVRSLHLRYLDEGFARLSRDLARSA